MAESYTQRKSAVKRQISATRNLLSRVNARLETMRREAKRLSERKTLITPESLDKLIQLYNDMIQEVNGVDTALVNLTTVARTYL
jgi:ribosomal protein S19